MKPKTTVKGIRPLLAKVYRKMERICSPGKDILHFSSHFVATRRSTAPVRSFTKSSYTNKNQKWDPLRASLKVQ